MVQRNDRAGQAAGLQAPAAPDAGKRTDQLIQVLHRYQSERTWLSRDTLAEAAAALGMTLAEVEGVASFYRFFHLQPVGRYHLLWSDNITDRMLGNQGLMRELCQKLWIEPGKRSEDGLVSTAYTSCTGLADQGPALLVNQHQVITRMSRDRVRQMSELILSEVPVAEWPAEWMVVDDQIRRADALLSAPRLRGEALQACHYRGVAATQLELAASGLRGRGGAGFPTARKWAACAAAALREGQSRVIVCNADEGEPGTFKDRVLLSQHADAVFEGMTVAAALVGARLGLVYLRGEYRFLLPALKATLEARRAAGLLGRRIQGNEGLDFDIEIHLGAGAYVCGEESSLIDSLEGRRGNPRIRPPYPVEVGYLGQPTVVNNVETFCAAAHIAMRGGAWWASMGTPESTGTKIHSVSGDCARPGIYEYPLGVTVEQLLHDCGAGTTQAVHVGGPSGVCLAPDEFRRRLAFEDVPTTGSMMVFDDTRDLFEVARNFAQFFAHESCGFCTPCRVGTTLAVRLMDKIARGQGSPADLGMLEELDRVLKSSAHCGLGTTAGNALRDTLLKFRPAYQRRLGSEDFVPAFKLDAALSQARAMIDRSGLDESA